MKQLYLSKGNPFLDKSASTTASSTNSWRIDFFNALLKESSPEHGGWRKDNLPELDGYPPTWNEKRYLVESSHSGFLTLHQSDKLNERHAKANELRHRSHAELSASPATVLVSPRKFRQHSEASARTAKDKQGIHVLESFSPPSPMTPLPSESHETEASRNCSTQPKIVKRKNRRVVDLDGHGHPTSTRRHERSASSPDVANSPDKEREGQGMEEDAKRGQPHTISSHFTTTSKSHTISRKLMNATFELPEEAMQRGKPKTGKLNIETDTTSGSGSEVEEFRRKMEKLRDEVGTENWLSVYASSSQANTPSLEKTQNQLQATPKDSSSDSAHQHSQIPKNSK